MKNNLFIIGSLLILICSYNWEYLYRLLPFPNRYAQVAIGMNEDIVIKMLGIPDSRIPWLFLIEKGSLSFVGEEIIPPFSLILILIIIP